MFTRFTGSNDTQQQLIGEGLYAITLDVPDTETTMHTLLEDYFGLNDPQPDITKRLSLCHSRLTNTNGNFIIPVAINVHFNLVLILTY